MAKCWGSDPHQDADEVAHDNPQLGFRMFRWAAASAADHTMVPDQKRDAASAEAIDASIAKSTQILPQTETLWQNQVDSTGASRI